MMNLKVSLLLISAAFAYTVASDCGGTCALGEGFCIDKSNRKSCPEEPVDELCKGKNCTCCVPDAEKCYQTEDCEGRCVDKLDSNEIQDLDECKENSGCFGKNCLCCPKGNECGDSTPCNNAGGFCYKTKGNYTCSGKINEELCEGEDCSCCSYDHECGTSRECHDQHGVCYRKQDKHLCQGHMEPDFCTKESCFCCIPRN